MRTVRFFLRWLCLAAVIAGMIVGLPAAAAESEPIKIAILVPLTGGAASFGTAARDGALLAIDQQNASGGILGRAIAPVIEDTACNADQAVNAANKVINQDGVQYIIGDVCSSSSLQVAGVAAAAGVIQVTPSATNPLVTLGSAGQVRETVFRACFLDVVQGTAAAQFAAASLDAQTAFILRNLDNPIALNLASAFETEFLKSGTIIGNEPYREDTTDFSAILAKIKDYQPDVIYLPDHTDIVNLVTAQAKTMGVTIPFVGGDGWDGSALDLSAASGGYFINHFAWDAPRPEVSAFYSAFSGAYGYAPNTVAALAYDAAQLIFQAMGEAGTTDPALVKTNLASISHTGATGRLYYEPQHNPLKTAWVMSVSALNGVRYFSAIDPEKPPATLAINYPNGSPGSTFILTGTYFPAGGTAAITINQRPVGGPLAVNNSGGFVFRLDTSGANEGMYSVTAAVNPSATAGFRLDAAYPQRPLEGSGPLIVVPAGIAFSSYLPIVQQ